MSAHRGLCLKGSLKQSVLGLEPRCAAEMAPRTPSGSQPGSLRRGRLEQERSYIYPQGKSCDRSTYRDLKSARVSLSPNPDLERA